MKKKTWIAVVAGLVLLLICACNATAEGQLPAGIRDSLGGVKIVSSVSWEDPGRGTAWFVLTRTGDGTNTLHCFVQRNGSWTKRFSTSKAVPQGKTGLQ